MVPNIMIRFGWIIVLFYGYFGNHVDAFVSLSPLWKQQHYYYDNSFINHHKNKNNNHHPTIQTNSAILVQQATTLSQQATTLSQQPIPTIDLVLHDPYILLSNTTIHWINELVQRRIQARIERNYVVADTILHQLSNHLEELPSHCSIRVTDTLEGGSYWSVLYHIPIHTQNNNNNNTTNVVPSILHIAHMLLGSRVVASKQQQWDSITLNEIRDQLVQQAKQPLQAWYQIHSQFLLQTSQDNDNNSNNLLTIHMNATQWQSFLQSKDLLTWATVEYDLRGRKGADAAFWFALAGVTDETLFQWLTEVVCKELYRFGTRSSCRVQDIHSIAKRMTAAGIYHPNHKNNNNTSSAAAAALQHVIQKCLVAKNVTTTTTTTSSSTFFHSDGCALMLWKFSTRQRKQRSFLDQAAQHWNQNTKTLSSRTTKDWKSLSSTTTTTTKPDWYQLFQDPYRPLVIDIGCGMGICLLGLATSSTLYNNNNQQQQESKDDSIWKDCNFLGIDLNPVTIGYGLGMAQRWKLSNRLNYIVDTAENIQHILESYPGPVSHIFIQFPTPYRFMKEDNSVGNTQLPRSATDGFMVSISLLRQCHQLLIQKNTTTTTTTTKGELWIQSNCEDVAVYIRNTACKEAGFEFLSKEWKEEESSSSSSCSSSLDSNNTSTRMTTVKETQRTLQWIQMGGERAQGPGWYTEPLLPRTAMTETEVACLLNETPVHRCILIPSQKK